jgi:hypothetical protein
MVIYETFVECNLCGMQFKKDDKDLVHRQNAHNIFHSKARIQKRNTTQGIPVYNLKVVFA